ncbi:Hypothetical protein ORPV_877 [Orpheovirus IHUMI-LCC2]|uniref:Uncharacterized protein n=1 Tax=Orpheovirus IHUMI-LCC2 TaxID=2023057 RepID=A0A2I2L5J3_9VIRU|nr:Hypothetical protein ORPV_877 [Orpheovirus IHUMI-LCC2]SNW62781.1 Hypothetical protein ORPV_877 [Orpheovirus IHUMI-LCC2]
MDNQEILAPNYIIPELPIDVNMEIVKNISPYDIPSFCYVVRTSNNMNFNQCNGVIEQYYGRKGVQIFNKLSIEEIEKLNGCVWPTLNFVVKLVNDAKTKEHVANILDVIDRAFSLRYDEDTLRSMVFAINKLPSQHFNTKYISATIDGIIFKYNRLDVIDINRKDYSLYYEYTHNYIENGGDISKIVGNSDYYIYSYAYRLLERLTYSTFPRFLFSKLKPYIFQNNIYKRKEDYFLIDLYNKPLEEAHKLIFDNVEMITRSLGRIAYCVYTQRLSYDYNMAGYLIQLAKHRDNISINSDIYSDLYKYVICMQDINLYKITTHIINIEDTITYNYIKNINVNNIRLVRPRDEIFSSHWVEYEYKYDPLFVYISYSFLKKYDMKFDEDIELNNIITNINPYKIRSSINILSVLSMCYFDNFDDHIKLLRKALVKQL